MKCVTEVYGESATWRHLVVKPKEIQKENYNSLTESVKLLAEVGLLWNSEW